MKSENIFVWIALLIEIFSLGAEGQTVCSCYSFVSDPQTPFLWQQAKASCISNNSTLVVMETEEEWQFIDNEIKSRTSSTSNEWLIGLYKNRTTGNWTWLNGKPLTIDKWQPGKPKDDEMYALIAKKYPPGTHGLFNSILSHVARGWICEKETVDCLGVCWIRNQQPTTPPIIRTTTTSETTSSTAGTSNAGTSDSTEPVTTARNDKQTDNGDESPTALIAAASVAGVLLILIVILATCFILRRRKRRSKDAESPSKKSNPPPQKPENQYDSIDPSEAANLLGTPKDSAYAESRRKDKQESPKVECEYAMVDKSGKKQNKEGLVYAQLAEFDAGNDDAKVHKPAPYEPTVYADVNQPQVLGGTDPDSAQPTYANVQSSPV